MFTCLSRKQSKPVFKKKQNYQNCKDIKLHEEKYFEQKKIEQKAKQTQIVLPQEIKKNQKAQMSVPHIIIDKISEKQSMEEISIKQINKQNILIVQSDIKQKFSVSQGAENVNQSLVSQTRAVMFNQSAFGTTSFGLNLQLTQFQLKKQIVEVVQNLTRRPTFLTKINQNSFDGMRKMYSQSLIQQSQNKSQQINKRIFQDINLQFSKALIQRNYEQAFVIYKQMNIFEKNQADKFGFSPIYLATLISIFQKDGKSLDFLKKILKDQAVNPIKKISQGSKPIQSAILYKNISVLTNLFRASCCHRIHEVKKSLKQFAQKLTQFPDMQIQLYIKVGSFVPLVDKLTPDDTIKIYKSGNNLRIDYSLVGYSFLQSKRRHMSCIIQKLPNQQYTILIINHDKKCYTDLFDPFSNQELILIIQDLLSMQIKRTNPNINKTSIKLQHNIFNQTIKQYISTGFAFKHQLKVAYTSNTQKLQPKSKNPVQQLNFLKNWENYQKYKYISHVKKNKKQLKLGVWLCKQSPLQLNQLLEIMKFLSFAHQGGQIVYNFLNDEQIKNTLEGFPMKIQIPMSFSLYLDIKISNIILQKPKVQFDFLDKYQRQKRVDYQKTLFRKQKRAALIKFYT